MCNFCLSFLFYTVLCLTPVCVLALLCNLLFVFFALHSSVFNICLLLQHFVYCIDIKVFFYCQYFTTNLLIFLSFLFIMHSFMLFCLFTPIFFNDVKLFIVTCLLLCLTTVCLLFFYLELYLITFLLPAWVMSYYS